MNKSIRARSLPLDTANDCMRWKSNSLTVRSIAIAMSQSLCIANWWRSNPKRASTTKTFAAVTAPSTSSRAKEGECEPKDATPTDSRSHAGRKKGDRIYFVRPGPGISDKTLPRDSSTPGSSPKPKGTARCKKVRACARYTLANSNNHKRGRPLRMERFEIFIRKRMLETLVLPINGDDPPPLAIIEQLDAVDPAHERFGIVEVVT